MLIIYILTIIISYFILRQAYIMAKEECNMFEDVKLWMIILILILPLFLNVIGSLVILMVQIPDDIIEKFFKIND